MITCYYGKLGQGKTYALAEHALRELEAGRIVYSNFFLDWQGLPRLRMGPFQRPEYPKSNWRVFHSVEEFMVMSNAFVALDEGWIYFDSYDMTKLPIAIRMKILQSRKDGLDIAYTTQRPEQVHKSLRAMTNEYWECEATHIPFVKYPVFKRYPADLIGDSVKRLADTKWVEKPTAGGSEWIEVSSPHEGYTIWPKKTIFSSFDTSEKIALPVSQSSRLRHAVRIVE